MESRPEPKPIVQHVPDLGGVQNYADFSENPAVVTEKRQTKQTKFYQPENTKKQKPVARFPRCEMCKHDTSVRFCDAICGYACVPCRQRGYECLKGLINMPLPPQSIGNFKKNRQNIAAPAPPAPLAPPLPAMLAAPAVLLPPNVAILSYP